MFSVAYVILPFSDVPPADAIRTSLDPFQRGGRGDLPEGRLAFHDETDALRAAHEAAFTFRETEAGGLSVEGGGDMAFWRIDAGKISREMRRRGLRTWTVRFADEIDLDTFHDQFGRALERHPETGGYGRWLNPLGRWDWWDLGGRFDGLIVGEPGRRAGRTASQVSSGDSPGRRILANIQDILEDALGQAPEPSLDIRTDRNVELVATLLSDARAGLAHARPGALVLPPGAVADALRWLTDWPEPGPAAAFAWLGLPPDAGWPAAAEAAYARFEDCWAAGVAYHL